ncbi:hypothetical protein ACHAP9_003196 [Verticillium nonalfalfae]
MASLAAWSTDMGDQLVLQAPISHLLYHSSCNTSNDLVFPVNDPFVLETEFPPKEHSSLAGVGWFDAVTTWACLWYQDSSNNLVYARYECNATSGAYALHNSEIISTALPDGIALHDRTALNAVLLGAEEGIRVYVHDEERRIHELSFHNPTGWLHGGLVADQPGNGFALASAASAEKEVTVIVPGDQRIQVLQKGIEDAVWDRSLCTMLPVVVVLALCAACFFTHRMRQAATRQGPRRAPSRTRPRSTDLAFRHVRPYSEFGELSWEDGVSEDTTTVSPWRRKRGWTC